MRLFEFESKAFLRHEGISVPEGLFTNNPSKVAEFVEKMGRSVVKAQTLIGNRMEVGGIRFVDVPEQGELASEMLFDTSLHEEEVIGVRVEQYINIEKEYFVCFHYNSQKKSLVFSFSFFGGKNISKVDINNNDDIFHLLLPVNQDVEWRIRNFVLSVFSAEKPKLVRIINQLYHFYLKYEFSLLEINPLVLNDVGEYIVVDVLAQLDSLAMGRHPELFIAPRLSRKTYSSESDFKKAVINIEDARGVRTDFVHLGGDIASLCVGGAMSLTVVDYINKMGGKPYNYAEVRANASSVRLVHMLKTFLKNDDIKALLILGSTFGNLGLDSIATGIRNALKEIQPSYPIVLRVTGLGREMAKDISKGLKNLNMTVLREETTVKQSVELIMEKAYGDTNKS
jgi:succinyl-CoA synthetase beta subunit